MLRYRSLWCCCVKAHYWSAVHPNALCCCFPVIFPTFVWLQLCEAFTLRDIFLSSFSFRLHCFIHCVRQGKPAVRLKSLKFVCHCLHEIFTSRFCLSPLLCRIKTSYIEMKNATKVIIGGSHIGFQVVCLCNC